MKTNLLKALTMVSLGAFLTACAPFSVGHVRVGDTPARRIAKDTSIPGKGVDGQCLPFARALHARFQAAGIPSKIITYNYESLSTPLTGGARTTAGGHAVVAYEDGGRTYVTDNQSWLPTWVGDASTTGLVQQFSGMDFSVGNARVVTGGHARKNPAPTMTLAAAR